MSKQDTKQRLLEAGTSYVIQHGYHYSGLNEILGAAGVPKGSFYYYFHSKEDFGLQILAYFAENTLVVLQRFLDDESAMPLERLRKYFEHNVEYLSSHDFRQGCLLGTLGQEMANLNEEMRRQIETSMQQWASQLGDGLALAQQQGQISSALDPQELGNVCLDSWQGAMLRMKVTKDDRPLRAFTHYFFDVMLSLK